MEFKVQSSELLDMLKVVIKGYDSRDDSSYIFFNINDNKLEVSSTTNSTSFFKGKVDITGYSNDEDTENAYYVEGDILRRLISIFPSAPIDLKFSINDKSRVFTIKYTGHSFRLPIISEGSPLPEPDIMKLGQIQAVDFFDVLNSLTKIVDTDPAAQDTGVSCLHLNFKDRIVSAMGTDRFAIAERKIGYDPENDDQDLTFLIRQAQASLLSKPINPAEVLQLVYTANQFGYIDGAGITSLVGRTQFEPINYGPFKEQAQGSKSITVDYDDFKNSLSTIGKLAVNNTILLTVNPQGVQLLTAAGDVMDLGTSSIEGITDDEKYKFTLKILEETLIPVDTHTLRLQWGETAGLFQVVPVDDDGNDEEGIFIGVVSNDD